MPTRSKAKPALGEAFRRRNSVEPPEAGAVPASPFPDIDAAVGSLTKLLPLESIEPMPGQPRGDFDDDALADLAASIAERGVLQPVRVKPLGDDRYQLVAGERRWRASRQAGLEAIPAFICAPGDPTDEFADALVENLLRQDLSDIEVGRGLESLMSDWGVDQTEAAKRLGFSKSKASKLLATLRLPQEIQKNIKNGHLTLDHVEPLLPKGLSDEQRIALAREAIDEGWGSRAFRRRVAEVRAHVDGDDDTPGKPRARTAGPPADQVAYAQAFGDALSAATKVDVSVVATRGRGYQIRVASHEGLEEIAKALGLTLSA